MSQVSHFINIICYYTVLESKGNDLEYLLLYTPDTNSR